MSKLAKACGMFSWQLEWEGEKSDKSKDITLLRDQNKLVIATFQ